MILDKLQTKGFSTLLPLRLEDTRLLLKLTEGETDTRLNKSIAKKI